MKLMVEDYREDKTDIATPVRFLGLLEEWVEILNLSEWKFKIRWVAGLPDAGSPQEGYVNVGVTYPNWSYQRATIEVLVPTWADMDDAEFEGHLVHELSHILLDPIDPDTSSRQMWRLMEYTTELTARAVLKARHAPH